MQLINQPRQGKITYTGATNICKTWFIDEFLPIFRAANGIYRNDLFLGCFVGCSLVLCKSMPRPDEFTSTLDDLVEIVGAPGYPLGGWDAIPQATNDYRQIQFEPIEWRLTDVREGLDPGDFHWIVLLNKKKDVLASWDISGELLPGQTLRAIAFADLDILLEFLPKAKP